MNPLPILRDAWFFFSHNLSAIARLCLPLLLVEAVCQALLATQLGKEANPAYAMLLGVLFYPLYTAPLILFLAARSSGQAVTPGALFAHALRLWPAFALLSGLSALAIMLGLSLLVLPGIWIMIKLAFAEFYLVLHQQQPLRALQSSFELTKGRFWPICACLLSVLLPLWLLEAWTMTEPEQTLLWVMQQAANGFLQLFISVFSFRLFMLLTPSGQTNR